MRAPLPLLLAAVLFGCSSDSTVVAADVDPSTLKASGDRVDVHFLPARLALGESVSVSSGTAALESTATAAGHHVRLKSPGRRVLQLSGLLDGREAVSLPLNDPHGAEGGVTQKGPTSIHKVTICDGGYCAEVIEYDYDLHDPSGDGTTEWRSPDGQTATIDRLRFVMEASAVVHHDLTVTTPEPLRLAR